MMNLKMLLNRAFEDSPHKSLYIAKGLDWTISFQTTPKDTTFQISKKGEVFFSGSKNNKEIELALYSMERLNDIKVGINAIHDVLPNYTIVGESYQNFYLDNQIDKQIKRAQLKGMMQQADKYNEKSKEMDENLDRA